MSNSIQNPQQFSHLPQIQQHHLLQKNHESYQQTSAASRDASIVITTDEGDVVTFSSMYSRVNALSAEMLSTPAGYSQNFTAASLEQDSYTLTVQGDLSEEELADIKDLMDELRSIAAAFFEGDMQKALAEAMEIGDMGSLAELSATFRSSVAVSTQMTQFHPTPALADDFSDRFEEVRELLTAERPDELRYSDMLRAQWEQIKEYLDNAQEQDDVLDTQKSVLAPKPENPEKQMMHRIEKTIEKHPRLSPFMTSLVKKSLDSLDDEKNQPAAYGLKRKLIEENFQKEFRNWLIEA